MSGLSAAGRSNVRAFRSATELAAEANLATLVAKARAANPIGVADWGAPRWEFPRSGRASAASEGGLRFTLRSANTSDPGVMPEPFASFVKTIVCVYNQRASSLYACGQSQTIIAAARLLYAEIADRGGDPTTLRHGDFEAAAVRAREAYGEGAANVGSKLVVISEEMDRHGLAPVPIGWRSPLRRDHKHDRVGDAATARRHAKLPSTAILDALAEISSRPNLPDRDLILQRGIDLLACGGFRLNELLTLPLDTWLEEPVNDEHGRQMLDAHGRPAVRVGLRYWPEKRGHKVAQIKWLSTVMVDVARRALDDILRMTAPARQVARHQAGAPGTTLLREPWDGLPPEHLLTARQVAEIVGLKRDDASRGSGAGVQFLREGGLPVSEVRLAAPDGSARAARRQLVVMKGDLSQYLWRRSQHGNVLGDIGHLDVTDCLFLLPLFFIKKTLDGGLRGTVQLLSDAALQVYLVSQANGNQPSIFERLGYLDAEGRPLRMNSHQFRHLLNTLAQEGGLSQMEIARWMGRSNVTQNAAYDHVSPLVRAQRVRERLLGGEAMGPVADAALAINDPVRRKEFVASTHQAAHVTDLGLCVHPWDAMPCTEMGACQGCDEFRIVKGDREARERACDGLARTERLLAIAAAEAGDETYGADNWREAQRASAEGLRRVLAVHDDAGIPDGTLVQLPRLPTPARVGGVRGDIGEA